MLRDALGRNFGKFIDLLLGHLERDRKSFVRGHARQIPPSTATAKLNEKRERKVMTAAAAKSREQAPPGAPYRPGQCVTVTRAGLSGRVPCSAPSAAGTTYPDASVRRPTSRWASPADRVRADAVCSRAGRWRWPQSPSAVRKPPSIPRRVRSRGWKTRPGPERPARAPRKPPPQPWPRA